MAQEIIKNLSADTVYTLPQQYTAVVGGAGIVGATAGNSFITITSGGGYIDYLMTILFRSNTGIQFPKVYILLVQPLDSTKFELVSIVSFYQLSATELVLNVGRQLTNSYAAADLLTIQTDAQYAKIDIQTASYTGLIAVLDQAQAVLTAAVPPSFDNNFAGGPPMAICGQPLTVSIVGGGGDRTSVDPAPPSFKLTWDAIGNALHTTVGDYNTLLGSDFTTLTVDGNDQLLTGNSTTFAMPANAFKGKTNLVAVDDTAESCTMLDESAFQNCTALTTVSLPACTSVGDFAFGSCTALTTVSLPACTSVGDKAFQGCTSLTTASLPACTTVGISAFKNCTSLTTVSFPACTSLGDSAFEICIDLTTILLPACTSLGDSAFNGCTALTTASLPVCTTVGSGVFYGCTALTSVSLPLCEDLGGTNGNDGVFGSITGQTITLTIAASRATCNGGAPDGDIVFLAANNTATIIYV